MDMPLLDDQQELTHLCTDPGCGLDNLPGTMDDWDEWSRKSEKPLLATRLDVEDIRKYISELIPKRNRALLFTLHLRSVLFH